MVSGPDIPTYAGPAVGAHRGDGVPVEHGYVLAECLGRLHVAHALGRGRGRLETSCCKQRGSVHYFITIIDHLLGPCHMVVELPYFFRTESVLRADVPVPVLKLSINVSALYLCLLLVYLTLLWWEWDLTEYLGSRISIFTKKTKKKQQKYFFHWILDWQELGM